MAGLPGLPATAATGAAPASVTTLTDPTSDALGTPGELTADEARAALAEVIDLVEPNGPGARVDGRLPRVDLTLAMRDLARALPSLTGRDREQAEALLARPTQGASDPYGFGYTTRAVNKCAKKICIHWVKSTTDAPPSKKWVKKSLKVMNRVWRHAVGKLGYRKPPSDGKRGPGRGKLDVYLKDLYSAGAYGFCAAERRAGRGGASGYCVLDNDFAESQYGAPPMKSLKATASHEFFHAVQFGYDYAEDRWLLESTATWMEERFADRVNDNRQYFPAGQLGKPRSSLDAFDQTTGNQYGNWVFWEYLSQRRGVGIVKKMWQRVQPTRRGNPYSVKALRGLLGKRFVRTLAAYSAANTAPARYYSEGKAWPAAPVAKKWKLGKTSRKAAYQVKLNHLSSSSVKVKTGKGLKGKRWKLRVRLNGPARGGSPAAYVTVKPRKGKARHTLVKLNRKGDGAAAVAVRSGRTKHVTVTLVNASTRYRCKRGTTFACAGKPLDQKKPFKLRLNIVKAKRR
ncbi:MXAN_6640 family putative metalloprotease [Nocardioides ferulae]|uniref:MXAN_6640 family putative metalloprotease n=1 Tax=Nocardioides ferulae TaxID=2340821 RepID=UPI000EAD1967|nr:MXAN_6640 family putative metalloprotease [Nocardioides ferulae]